MPLGHRDAHTGPGSSPPGRGQKLSTHRRVVKRRKNKTKVMAKTAIIPNTPQRGSMQLFCLTQETKGKGKDEPSATLLTTACGGDPDRLWASGGLPLALHGGAMAGGRTTTSQAGSTA